MYNAIHKYNFTKPSKTSRTVTITDRYDYKYEGISTLDKTAMTALYTAQLNGYLKPFYTKIKQTL